MNHVSKSALTAKEKANLELLNIKDGELTGVTGSDELGVTGSDKLRGNLVLPDTVKVIGYRALADCTGLTSVVIPDSVTKICAAAFTGCTNLTHLSVDTANTIYCSENNIIYKNDKKMLIAAAGKGDIVISSTVRKICYAAFSGCTGLNSIEIPGNVRVIGEEAFYHCTGLKNIEIPASVTVIEEAAFCGCTRLKSIKIPAGVRVIGKKAFSDINPNAHFTVKSKSVKELLLNSRSDIRDKQITVEPNL